MQELPKVNPKCRVVRVGASQQPLDISLCKQWMLAQCGLFQRSLLSTFISISSNSRL